MDRRTLSNAEHQLLQTATSILHMLRHAAAPLDFRLIPSPPPPYLQSPLPVPGNKSRGASSRSRTADTDKNNSKAQYALWEGFGTLVCVHKNDSSDRIMVIEIRPPSVLTTAVLRELVRTRRDWRSLSEYQGDIGQANLLQSQVSPECYRRGSRSKGSQLTLEGRSMMLVCRIKFSASLSQISSTGFLAAL